MKVISMNSTWENLHHYNLKVLEAQPHITFRHQASIKSSQYKTIQGLTLQYLATAERPHNCQKFLHFPKFL